MTYQAQPKFYPERQEQGKIKVVLVDDSNVARSIFERVLLSSGHIEIVGCAQSASEAIELLDIVKADIILLDIEMPNRTGLEALPEIIEKADGGKVIIVSSFVDTNGPAAIKALSLGACDTLSKPGKSGVRGDFSKQLVDMVMRLGGKRKHISNIPNLPITLPEIEKPKAIFIGASTGGIPSIEEFLKNISKNVTAPIFIAQHLPDVFISYFARQLYLMSKRKIISIYEKTKITDGNIYLAPGNGHMVVEKTRSNIFVNKIDEYDDSYYTPSVDALFHSAANAYGSDALAMILSGMGQDGCKGAKSLANSNSTIWSQDQESCVVWGMPGSAVKDGTSSAQLKPQDMAEAVNKAFSS